MSREIRVPYWLSAVIIALLVAVMLCVVVQQLSMLSVLVGLGIAFGVNWAVASVQNARIGDAPTTDRKTMQVFEALGAGTAKGALQKVRQLTAELARLRQASTSDGAGGTGEKPQKKRGGDKAAAQIARLEREKQTLTKQLAAAEQQLSQAQAELAKLQADRDPSTVSRLTAELEKLQAQLAEQKQARHTLDQRIAELRPQVRRLEDQLAEANEQCRHAQAQYGTASQEVLDLRHELGEVKTQLKRAEARAQLREEERNIAQQQLDGVQQQLARLQQDFAELKQVAAQRLEKLQAHRGDQPKTTPAGGTTVDSVTLQNLLADKTREVARLTDESARQRERIAQLQQRVEQLEHALQTVSAGFAVVERFTGSQDKAGAFGLPRTAPALSSLVLCSGLP